MLKVTQKLWNIIKELGSSKKCKTKIAKIGLKIRDIIYYVILHPCALLIGPNLVNYHV